MGSLPTEADWNLLTQAEFRDALHNGLGRAVIHAQRRMTDRILAPIEEALTHNLTYDPQCEGGRDEYLSDLVNAAGGLSQFRRPIIDALKGTESFYDASQLFTLCCLLAKEGDAEARVAVYDTFYKTVKTHDWPGALDIIVLDGREGLATVARAFGEQIKLDSTYWANDIRWFTTDVFGKGDIERALIELGQQDETIQLYLQQLQEPRKRGGRSPRPTDDELESMSFDDVLSLPVSREFTGPYAFQRWGRVAGYSAALEAANRVAEESDPYVMRMLLSSFYKRDFPGEPASLLTVFDRFADDHAVIRAAEVVLQSVESDEVRVAALDLIQSSQHICRGLALLCANYVRGDWDVIQKALNAATLDRDQLHDAGHWLLDIFDTEMTHDEPGAMLWMYENTPCSNCRGDAFKSLHAATCAPAWMYAELLKDSKQENRELAAESMRDSAQE